MGYRVGEHAGPYEILRLLGRGAFGEVLLARDPRQAQHCIALKTVACDQLAGDAAEKARRSALAEARLLRRLHHPHIVRCEEVCWDVERRVVWLALEFMDGGDAQSLIEARRSAKGDGAAFRPHLVRRVLAAVGSALRYVHDEGILHRDVKPANILLTRCSQRIKLGDFGISKILQATSGARSLVGTPCYLSPEVLSGQPYGPASDAWALGVCLYELAALRRPFEASNPLALVRYICETEPPALPSSTAADICCAVTGLLKRDAATRMPLCEALAVSDAVAALAPEVEPLLSQEHPASPESPAATGFGVNASITSRSPGGLSPVSLALSDSCCGPGSPGEDGAGFEIVASLCGQPPASWTTAEEGEASARSQCWQDSQALVQARVALSADVDDPEELQRALRALEKEIGPLSPDAPDAEASQALVCELKLRLEALRVDAAALLQSFLDLPALEHTATPSISTMLSLAQDSCALLAEPTDMALADAIELASSLGVDTGRAEDHAVAKRRLLSLRIVWGTTVRFCLLPIGAPFISLLAEVMRRFGFQEHLGRGEDSSGGLSAFEFSWREGAENFVIRDQASWELFLRRRSLVAMACRLELSLSIAACVVGTRVLSVPASGSHQMVTQPSTPNGLTCRARPGVARGGALGPCSVQTRRSRCCTLQPARCSAPEPAAQAAVLAALGGIAGGWGVRGDGGSHSPTATLRLEGRAAIPAKPASVRRVAGSRKGPGH